MRIWLAILLLSSVSSFACGPYYPYGEATRFNLLKAESFDFKDFATFNYTAASFWPPEETTAMNTAEKQNVALWQKRYNNQVNAEEVYEGVYSNNQQFQQYLEKNDPTTLIYLNFAKACSQFNSTNEDPWERNASAMLPERTTLIEFALEQIKKLDDEELSLRYAFIAIRLAYYNGEKELVNSIYADYFSCRTMGKNILDYWGLYFQALVLPKGPQRNFSAAQVFWNASDKRFMIHQKYDKTIPIAATLKLATTDLEKSAVWLLHGVRNPGPALDEIKKIHELTPNAVAVDFMLIRELNKLEDWIYTPYYANFSPSVYGVKNDDDYDSYPASLKQIKVDRLYAKKMLTFVQTATKKKEAPSKLWKIATAYLQHMTANSEAAISDLDVLIKQEEAPELKNTLTQLQAICKVSSQKNGAAEIPVSLQQQLVQQDNKIDHNFLFALGRELEFKGNTSDAAVLYSLVNGEQKNGEALEDFIYWRSKHRHNTIWSMDYYDDYFYYLDAQYSTKEVKALIKAITPRKEGPDFARWKSDQLKADLPRLYDLLGTKYMRENRLTDALNAFKMVDPAVWTSDDYHYARYLDANPFYADFHSAHEKTEADTITYNKVTLTRQLLEYLAKADNLNTQDRAYYYFLVANCYFNMTQYGNSWMMKRYYWSTNANSTGLADDAEYFHCRLAAEYYLKAKSTSKTKKFGALCLRMAARCETYHLEREIYENQEYPDHEEYHKRVYLQNKHYQKLEADYPDDNEELVSNCYSFEEYFKAR